MKKQMQRGFTMIELVIVIAVLGILAAFALPRFASFTTQAQTATKAGVVGTVNSAIGIAHAQWLAQGSSGTVTLDNGVAMTMNATGYPDINVTYNTAALCGTVLGGLLNNQTGLTIGYAAPNCTISGSGWTVNVAANLAS